MDRFVSRIACVLALVAGGSGFASAQQAPSPSALAAEEPFLTENNQAMNQMMTDMTVKPTGDADVDFARMMIPHHQGAIDMAKAELKYGKNEVLRHLAQAIIVDQQREIAVMQQQLPPAEPGSIQMQPSMHMDMKMNGNQSK
jgi:uncharacterized protein (DUF305 family)